MTGVNTYTKRTVVVKESSRPTPTTLTLVPDHGTETTVLSYVASNGSIDLLEQMLQLPGLDPNKPDNEGNTPLHFAAQAGQIECLNCMLSRCRGIEIDARNNLGFTPLMKAALQGRNNRLKPENVGNIEPREDIIRNNDPCWLWIEANPFLYSIVNRKT
ncbi:hypothetical protein NQ315_000888 [Exocentrus adspersus]|uniref:Uncharacterized protein n=1 Tax=Exocentrus adspersus TaxID=1586481 RepID=A0AAV8WF03_9CUCU|nr:hypothetical protein NQ315_000888 [Exocentrus adspersus]